MVVGPRRLVSFLETALGLGGPEVPDVRRIAAMRAKLEAAGTAQPRFWSDSFSRDSWATARELLTWRDSLVAGGWKAGAAASASARLRDLGAAEAAQPEMPPGFADRVAAVHARLVNGKPPRLPWTEIRLIESREAQPVIVARLLDALAETGVNLVTLARDISNGGKTDLEKLQQFIGGSPRPDLVGDGTVTLLTAETETAAADLVADWLHATGDPGLVAILGGATGMLDAALSRRGSPRLGHRPSSPQRSALQVLPLAFATRWEPFDPFRLLDLLLLPLSPIPRAVARSLAQALTEAPGRGGAHWTRALEEGLAARRAQLAKRPGMDDATRLERKARADELRWRPWFDNDLHDPASGIPAAEAKAVCARVAAWAISRATGDPILGGLVMAAQNALEAIEACGLDPLPRLDLDRILADALRDGTDHPDAGAEAATWSCVLHPGQIWDRPGRVLWWGFVAGKLPAPAEPWTRTELAALEAAGVRIDTRAARIAREAEAWRGAVLAARERILLVAPATLDGSPTEHHPLRHELDRLLDARGVRVDAVSGLTDKEVKLAGHEIRRDARAVAAIPRPRDAWTIAPGLIRPRETESASSIEKLLGCPLAWTLQYQAKLRQGSRAQIPEGERLIGMLAHELAARLLPAGASQVPSDIGSPLEILLSEQAAPLALPGRAADLARVRAELPRAMRFLGELLGKHGLRVNAIESEHRLGDALAPGIALEGRLDMLLTDARGQPAVLDLKWTGTQKYRREEVLEGRAVQLAAYGRLVGDPEAPAPSAYLLLAQQVLLPTGGGAFGPAPRELVRDARETWSLAVEAWSGAMKALADGSASAPGALTDKPEKLPPLDTTPPCRFCEFTSLCRHGAAS